jgi:hypothetical protein
MELTQLQLGDCNVIRPMHRKTKILVTFASICLAVSCLFPPWSWVSTHIAAAGYGFLLGEHSSQRIDFTRLMVEWVGIAAITTLIALTGETIWAYIVAVWRPLIRFITVAVHGLGRAIVRFFSWHV